MQAKLQFHIQNDRPSVTECRLGRAGKSTLLRQVCLAALLAQVGAWVPAESLEMTPVDAIFVRMGARDAIMTGQVGKLAPAIVLAFGLHPNVHPASNVHPAILHPMISEDVQPPKPWIAFHLI